MKLILLGPPGSGKGTQAQKIEQKYNLKQLATGDLLRDEIKSESKIGREVKKIIDRGELVSDKIIISLIENSIDKKKFSTGFILDGFPRTTDQARALDEMLSEKSLKMDHVIRLEVDENAIAERLSGRFSCAECGVGYHDIFKKPVEDGKCDKCGSQEFLRRSDDKPGTVRSRLVAYREQTAPIIPYYSDKGVLQSIDGMGTMDEVFGQINEIVAGG